MNPAACGATSRRPDSAPPLGEPAALETHTTREHVIESAKALITAKDWPAYAALIAEDVQWFTPLFKAPVTGKAAMLAMQPVVLGEVFDEFAYVDIGYGERYAYMHFVGRVGGVPFEGTDRVVVENGLLTEFHVDGRTLSVLSR